MKLRQKLAVTMAAAMMLTAVPVVTMAGSTNSVISPSLKVEKDKPQVLPGISINLKDTNGTEEFYLRLDGAKWLNVEAADLDQANADKLAGEVAELESKVSTGVDELVAAIDATELTEKTEALTTEVEKISTQANKTSATSDSAIKTAIQEFNTKYAAYVGKLQTIQGNIKNAVEENSKVEYIGTDIQAVPTALAENLGDSLNVTPTDDAAVAVNQGIIDAINNALADLAESRETAIAELKKVTLAVAPQADEEVSEAAKELANAGFKTSSVEGGTWDYSSNGVKITYTRQSDSVVKINITNAKQDKITLPLPVNPSSEEVKVAIDAKSGKNTSVTEGEYTIATTANKAFSLSVATGDDAQYFYNEGQLSAITLKETYPGAFNDKLVLRIELDNLDFEFDEDSEVTVKGSYGFDAETKTAQIKVHPKDASTAFIIIPAFESELTCGELKIEGIRVFSNEKDIDLGELKADITAVTSEDKQAGIVGESEFLGKEELIKDYTDVVVAQVEKYGATITMKDEKAVDIVAGREEEVEFTVKENVDDVFVGKRTIKLTLKDNEGTTDKQYFMISHAQMADQKKIITENAKVVKDVEFTYVDKDADMNENSKYYENGVVRVSEIKVTFEQSVDGKEINKNDKRDSFKVKTKVYVPVGEQEKKTVDIVGELRGEEVKAATAVNVVDPFDVTFDTTTLKVGLQDQVINTFSVKETDKAMFQRGNLYLDFVSGKKDAHGITLESKGDLKTEGDLKKADLGSLTQGNKVELKRQSKSAAALTFENAKVTVDRTTPEGSYDLELSGDAIDKYDGSYSVSKFLNIGTQNTQDIQETNGLAKVESKFTIGSNKYTVEGVEKDMDATPYIQDGGYTMIPVRYVADALGVKPQNILANGGVVTIFAGNRTIQLTNGSNVAVVNGAQISLATKVVIKEGRTYVPVGEIGRMLGIQVSWDNETKTATFKN